MNKNKNKNEKTETNTANTAKPSFYLFRNALLAMVGIAAISVFTAYSCTSNTKKINTEVMDAKYMTRISKVTTGWPNDASIIEACSDESKGEGQDWYLDSSTIDKLLNKAVLKCATVNLANKTINISAILAEIALVPPKASIPYELAKLALGSSKNPKCLDYIKPIIVACPKTIKNYINSAEELNN